MTMVELSLGSARGSRAKAKEIQWSVLRALEPADLPLIQNPPQLPAAPVVRQLRSAHHQIAQLIAKGEDNNTVALITGYSACYISGLKSDPAFSDLICHYTDQRKAIFVDVVERMRALGIAAQEELLARLEADPDKWTKRELMELIDRCGLVPTGKPGSASPGGTPPVTISVNFVSPNRSSGPSAPVLEATAREIRGS